MGSHHGRVIAESQRCELAAVVDPVEFRGRGLAERFGADWRPAIGNLSGIDAVVIASPTDQHRTAAFDVLAEGVPLLVEKPLCASVSETRDLVEAALRRGIPLMCGFVERFNPAVLAALSLVEHPDAVRAQRSSSYSPRMHAGVTWDLLVHDIDIVLRLFNEEMPKIVSSTTVQYGGEGRIGEDIVDAKLEFSDGRTAVLSASRVSSTKMRQLTISGRERTVVADLLNPSVTVYPRPASRIPPAVDDVSYGQEISSQIKYSGYREPLAAQWDRFVDILEGKADASAETRSILPSHEVVAAILDSADERIRNSGAVSP
jgi:predicted dehydrogenase